MISSFVLVAGPPRVSISLFQKCRFSSGLALPNFQHYYWTSNIYRICCWLTSPCLSWCSLEAQSCNSSSSISALVYSSLPICICLYVKNLVLSDSLKMWYQFRKHFKFTSAGPLCKNNLFPPSYLDSDFTLFRRQGVRYFQKIYSDGIFNTYDKL